MIRGMLRRHGKTTMRQARSRVRTQTRALVADYQKALSSPDTRPPLAQLGQVRSALQELRREVIDQGASNQNRLAAAGLQKLDHGFKLLGQAAAASDPSTSLRLLKSATESLDVAQKQAHLAGHAWPL
jgi:hypothetical protein